jgi:uncharacterized protein (TIGR02679 family)
VSVSSVPPRRGASAALPPRLASAALPARLATPALASLWTRCWKAMARAGPDDWHRVTIRLPLDDEQRRAVAGLLGRPIRPGTATTAIALADLDAVLARGGDGVDLVTVVTAHHGPLPDRSGDAEVRHAAFADARTAALRTAPDEPWVGRWLDGLERGTLARLYGRGELDLLVTAAEVLAALPDDGLPLPVLAARVTGDTKALGATTLAGLVLKALALRAGEPPPRTATERRALWESVGVVPDDLASQVLVLNLPVTGGLLAGWLDQAAGDGLPVRVTLQQLTRHPFRVARPQPVYVCENPAVLRAAAERLGAGSAPLVCLEGRPSVAATRLLTALADGGCALHCHGDLDWAGVQIAASVLSSLPAAPWRMAATDYLDAVPQDVEHPRASLEAGGAVATPWDPELARTMRRVGQVVYEEDVLADLLADLADAAPVATPEGAGVGGALDTAGGPGEPAPTPGPPAVDRRLDAPPPDAPPPDAPPPDAPAPDLPD